MGTVNERVFNIGGLFRKDWLAVVVADYDFEVLERELFEYEIKENTYEYIRKGLLRLFTFVKNEDILCFDALDLDNFRDLYFDYFIEFKPLLRMSLSEVCCLRLFLRFLSAVCGSEMCVCDLEKCLFEFEKRNLE